MMRRRGVGDLAGVGDERVESCELKPMKVKFSSESLMLKKALRTKSTRFHPETISVAASLDLRA
jgi:hypothetical protein